MREEGLPTGGRIPPEEVVFEPDSRLDPAGRIFRWRGGIYRAISGDAADFVQRLLDDGTIAELVRAGLLVETRPTPFALDGYGMVVRHKEVQFVSYPTEWCPAMLRDAALLTLELEARLTRSGATLKDAHPWNILFDGCDPVHIDLLSIVPLPAAGTWTAYGEFCREFLRPLLLSARNSGAARSLADTARGGTLRQLAAASPSTALRAVIDAGARRIRARAPRPRLERVLAELRRSITASVVDDEAGETAGPVESEAAAGEAEAVRKALEEFRPSSVLVAGGDCALARSAAAAGADVVAFAREKQSARLYASARAERLPILPLTLDHRSAAYPPEERLACDAVVVPGRRERLELLERFVPLTKRWLVVPVRPAEGHLERGAAAGVLGRHFRRVDMIGNGRDLILCEK
jgi:hypothetical protein